jgi:putative ABC transport system permease protein
MNLWNSLAIGLREIFSHKFRSFLTMLGVILGVASLLTTFALIEGLAKSQREMLNQTGGVERVSVVNQDAPKEQVAIADTSPGRTVADAEAIKASATLVRAVAPMYQQSVALQRGSNELRLEIRGVWPDHVVVNQYKVEYGRNLCQLDLDEAEKVCVVGTKVIEELWPENLNAKPLGETILVNQRPFKIVGILEHYESEDAKRARAEGRQLPRSPSFGGRRFNPYDRKNFAFLIPFTTAFYEFKSTSAGAKDSKTGVDDPGPILRIDELAFQVVDPNNIQPAIDEVRQILLRTHRGVEDFTFDTRQDWAETIATTTRNIRLVGYLISSIALVVGGIGITNIMLASITERIREIGVRRAIGAKSRHIFTQIVVESTVVAIFGGMLGIAAALGLMDLIKFATDGASDPIVDWFAALISFGFAVCIGIISGVYPAFQASRIEPIEALRYG